MQMLSCDYEGFGNSILEKHSGFGYLDSPVSLIFLSEEEEPEAEAAQAAIYNTYIEELHILKQENQIFEKNITFLTNLIQKSEVSTVEKEKKSEHFYHQIEQNVLEQIKKETVMVQMQGDGDAAQAKSTLVQEPGRARNTIPGKAPDGQQKKSRRQAIPMTTHQTFTEDIVNRFFLGVTELTQDTQQDAGMEYAPAAMQHAPENAGVSGDDAGRVQVSVQKEKEAESHVRVMQQEIQESVQQAVRQERQSQSAKERGTRNQSGSEMAAQAETGSQTQSSSSADRVQSAAQVGDGQLQQRRAQVTGLVTKTLRELEMDVQKHHYYIRNKSEVMKQIEQSTLQYLNQEITQQEYQSLLFTNITQYQKELEDARGARAQYQGRSVTEQLLIKNAPIQLLQKNAENVRAGSFGKGVSKTYFVPVTESVAGADAGSVQRAAEPSPGRDTASGKRMAERMQALEAAAQSSRNTGSQSGQGAYAGAGESAQHVQRQIETVLQSQSNQSDSGSGQEQTIIRMQPPLSRSVYNHTHNTLQNIRNSMQYLMNLQVSYSGSERGVMPQAVSTSGENSHANGSASGVADQMAVSASEQLRRSAANLTMPDRQPGEPLQGSNHMQPVTMGHPQQMPAAVMGHPAMQNESPVMAGAVVPPVRARQDMRQLAHPSSTTRAAQQNHYQTIPLVYGEAADTAGAGTAAQPAKTTQSEPAVVQKQKQKEIEIIKEITNRTVTEKQKTEERKAGSQNITDQFTIKDRDYIEQTVRRTLSQQTQESISLITRQVYRSLEDKLKSERGRRGLI